MKWVKALYSNRKVNSLNPTKSSVGLREIHIQNRIKTSDKHRLSEAVQLTVAKTGSRAVKQKTFKAFQKDLKKRPKFLLVL